MRRLSPWLLGALGVTNEAAQELGPRDGVGLPATDTCRVTVGAIAPDFTLEALGGRRTTLADYRRKWTWRWVGCAEGTRRVASVPRRTL